MSLALLVVTATATLGALPSVAVAVVESFSGVGVIMAVVVSVASAAALLLVGGELSLMLVVVLVEEVAFKAVAVVDDVLDVSESSQRSCCGDD